MLSRRRAAALLATAIVALAAPAGAHAAAQTAACPGADLVPDASNLAAVGQATLCLLNDERAAAGLRPLQYSAALTQPSAAYSARMVTENFFAHVSPDGTTLETRLTAARYINPNGDWFVGENLAWGQGDLATARNIAIAWMNSPGHRHNILEPDFTQVGIGIVPGTPGDPSWGATYTTDFGDVQAAPATAAASTVASAASAGAKATAHKAAAKKTTKKKAAAKTCKTTVARAAKARGRKATSKVKGKRVASCGTATGRSAAARKRS
jgi:uncharacterized protein YkwD